MLASSVVRKVFKEVSKRLPSDLRQAPQPSVAADVGVHKAAQGVQVTAQQRGKGGGAAARRAQGREGGRGGRRGGSEARQAPKPAERCSAERGRAGCELLPQHSADKPPPARPGWEDEQRRQREACLCRSKNSSLCRSSTVNASARSAACGRGRAVPCERGSGPKPFTAARTGS